MTLSAQPASAATGTSAYQATAPLMTVPISFKCPLTGQVMRDPVATCDGQVFERVAIESWSRHGHRTSPMTGMELEAFTVTPQPALRAAIEAFMLHPSTTGKVSSSYACDRNISHGQQEPTSSAAAMGGAAAAPVVAASLTRIWRRPLQQRQLHRWPRHSMLWPRIVVCRVHCHCHPLQMVTELLLMSSWHQFGPLSFLALFVLPAAESPRRVGTGEGCELRLRCPR